MMAQEKISGVTDTAVFQEIAYRYWAQKKWSLAKQIFSDMQTLFTEIYPIEKNLLPVYYAMLSENSGISPCDAIHLAVMKVQKIKKIYTIDKIFLKIPFVEVASFDV